MRSALERAVTMLIKASVAQLISLVVFSTVWANDCGSITVVLRHDDYTATTDLEMEAQLLAGLEDVNAKAVIGVVPFSQNGTRTSREISLSKEKVELLKMYVARGVAQIAAHGFSHQNNSKKPQKSEFVDLPLSEQTSLLETAKGSLELTFETTVSTFIPPWNQHDGETLIALEKSGYLVLSSSSTGPIDSGGALAYLPGTVYPQSFAETVRTAEKEGCDGIIVVTSHPYDFAERSTLPSFRSGSAMNLQVFLSQLSSFIAAGTIKVRSIDELVRDGEDLSRDRLIRNLDLRNSLITRHRLVPRFIEIYPVPGLFYSKNEADRLIRSQRLVFCGLFGAVVIASGFLGFRGGCRFRWGPCFILAGCLTVLCFGLVKLIGPSNIYLNWAMILTGLAGVAVGGALSAIVSIASSSDSIVNKAK